MVRRLAINVAMSCHACLAPVIMSKRLCLDQEQAYQSSLADALCLAEIGKSSDKRYLILTVGLLDEPNAGRRG
ncbi:hypothetical protein A6U92_03215 [Agrobacterium rubi]|nr:hypothetical protein A6U92_03215 [Agrobacterium rubi]